jgi:hypothetical protein
VKVVARITDWRRANDIACPLGYAAPDSGSTCDPQSPPLVCDPFGSDAEASSYLPAVPRCDANGFVFYQDVYQPLESTVSIPAATARR